LRVEDESSFLKRPLLSEVVVVPSSPYRRPSSVEEAFSLIPLGKTPDSCSHCSLCDSWMLSAERVESDIDMLIPLDLEPGCFH